MERNCSFKTRPPYRRGRGSGSRIGGLVGPEPVGTFWEKLPLLFLLRFEIRIVQLVVPAHQVKIKKDGKFCKKYPVSTDKGKMIRQWNRQEATTCLAVWNRTEACWKSLLSSAHTSDFVHQRRQSTRGKLSLPPLSVHISSQLIRVAGVGSNSIPTNIRTNFATAASPLCSFLVCALRYFHFESKTLSHSVTNTMN